MMNTLQQGSDSAEMDISHYLSIFNRHKWSILTLAILTSLLAGLIVFSQTPMYKATTKLLIESQMPKIPTIEDLYGGNNGREYLQTQFEIIQSRRIGGMVATKLYPALQQQLANEQAQAVEDELRGISSATPPVAQSDWPNWLMELLPDGIENSSEAVIVNPLQQKTTSLLRNLSVKPLMRTQIVEISFVSSNAVMAAKTANAFAQAYIGDQLESRIEMTRQGTSWLFDRLNVLKISLQQSETRLQQYLDSQKLLVRGGNTLTSDALSGATGRLIAARVEFDKVKKRYGYKHPKYIQAQSELSAAKATVVSSRTEIRNIGRKEVKLREFQRQVESDRELYNTFLKRLKETSQAVDYKKANARILDEALVPIYPFKPNKKRFIILAFMGGLFLGLLLAFLNEAMNKTIKSTEEVSTKLGQPNLGILPLLAKAKDGKISDFPILDKNETGYAESIRTIRTGLILSSLDNPHKIILVTSSVPGEGKSTVSTNLAMSMMQMEKVLLIGADMRRPTLQRNFDMGSGPVLGLSELVAGSCTLKDCVFIHEQSGLHVMAGGMIPPNPLELLSSERFKNLLEALEKHYDRIVIDSPPVQAVSDALVLATHAKAVVYVVEADKTHEKVVRKGISRLLEHGAPLAGIVLNKVDLKKAEKYGYEYGGYYDQYGYSSQKS